ncbi:MAG: hypothetical protein JWM11_3867 [Planctomycetaceae bacterium]|nr:hypothetical protein [Planctomycetaceae bacterium]
MSESIPVNEFATEPRDAPAPVPAMQLQTWHLIITALFAAGLAWPVLMHFEGAFPMENLTVEMTNRIRANAEDPIAWAKERQNQWDAVSRNSILNLGVFGTCLGLCLSLTLALVRGGPFWSMARTWAYGTGLGMIAGIAGGYLSARTAFALGRGKEFDVTLRSSLIHASGWIVPGLACGVILGLALGRRRLVRPAFGGMIGGLLAALLYEPLAAILFQLDRSDIPLPEGAGNKLMFLGLAAVLMLVGAWSAEVLPAARVGAPHGPG